MSRLLNFRPFAVIALILAASVFISLVAFNILTVGIILFAALGGLCLVAAAIFFVRRDKVKTITFVLALALSAVSAVAFFATALARFELNETAKYSITGRVTEYYGVDGDDYVFTIDCISADGEDIDGNMRVYLHGGASVYDFLICGYTVSFESNLSRNDLIDGWSVNASGIRNGVRYYAYPEELTVLSPGEAAGLEAVRLGLKAKLDEGMDEDASAVAYGMIIGDSHYISDEINDFFKAGGIGHILSVSGLHIGVLVAALSFLLKKCRVPRVAVPSIMIVLLTLYAVITGGSPTVVRACVMSFIMLLAPHFGRHDLFNSLCAAAVVCLMISPFYLFEIGFIMSFSAVFGLATLAPVLTRLLRRIKLPKFIASPLGSSLAVQIAITPATAFYFHSFYTYSLIVNAIAMPLLSMLYIVLLAALVLCLIFPFLTFLLTASGFLVGIMNAACGVIYLLPGAQLIMHMNASSFAVLPAMYLASDYIMVKKKGRILLNLVCCAAILLSPLYADSTFRADNSLVALNRGGTLVCGDKLYLTGDIPHNITGILLTARISGELYIYPSDMTESVAQNIIALSKTYTVKEVVIAGNEHTVGLKALLDAGLKIELTNYKGNFSAAFAGGSMRGWLYNGGVTTYITHNSSGGAPDEAAGIVRCKSAYSVSSDKLYLTRYRNPDAGGNVMSNTEFGNIVYDYGKAAVYSYK